MNATPATRKLTGASASASDFMTYQEAAAVLGVKLDTVRQLVKRSTLRTVPNGDDRRSRLLYRREVEARKAGTTLDLAELPPPPLTMPQRVGLSSQEAMLIGTGLVALGLLIFAARNEDDAETKGLALAALAALALVIVAEWYKQRTINRMERRRLEQLARNVESEPEALITELQRLGVPMPAAPANV